MNKTILGILLFITAIFLAVKIQPHARLADDSDVIPRGSEMKDSPCGENIRTNRPKVLQAGSKITIRWVETVEHSGNYWIEFSAANDRNWVRLKTIVDDQNNPATLPHLYETSITVPNVNCESCTMRLVQEMLDNHASMPTYYYSCGDIKIINAKC
jgi:hypothetical protein